jgi:hypothetical protein
MAGKETGHLNQTGSFARGARWESPLATASDFVRVPRELRGKTFPIRGWRIQIVDLASHRRPLGLDLLGDCILGRDDEADINLDLYDARDKGVSRQHALLRPTANGVLLIEMGSTNGTFLNGCAAFDRRAYRLSNGDLLTLGSLTLVVKIMDQIEIASGGDAVPGSGGPYEDNDDWPEATLVKKTEPAADLTSGDINWWRVYRSKK